MNSLKDATFGELFSYSFALMKDLHTYAKSLPSLTYYHQSGLGEILCKSSE
jgi:hypothetical protein